MKIKLFDTIKATAFQVGLSVKKHSPEILFITGAVGTVASTVIACRATTKMSKIIDEHNTTMEAIHSCGEEGELCGEEYTEDDAQKDTVITYAQTGFKIAKLYAPAVIISGLSLTCMFASNRILRNRAAAIGAAYAALSKTHELYRKRVADIYGEEAEKKISYGLKNEKITINKLDGSQEKATITTADPNLASEYAFYFDNTSELYDKNLMFSEYFLKAQQIILNSRLFSRMTRNKPGVMFENEVREALGLPITKRGQVVGITTDTPDGAFKLRYRKVYRTNTDGEVEELFMLDPNFQGNVLEKL
jgi:hypothetical protein